MTAQDNVLLRVKGLVKYFPVKKGVFRRTVGWVKAVDHVDLFIPRGDLGARRGVGVREDHLQPDHPPLDRAHRRRSLVPLQDPRADRQRGEGQPPPDEAPAAGDADHLPGPLLVPQPPDDRGGDHRGAARRPPGGPGPGDAEAGRLASRGGGPEARAHAALPHEFSGGSGSGLGSPGRLPSSPSLSCATSPSALSTSRSRPKC